MERDGREYRARANSVSISCGNNRNNNIVNTHGSFTDTSSNNNNAYNNHNNNTIADGDSGTGFDSDVSSNVSNSSHESLYERRMRTRQKRLQAVSGSAGQSPSHQLCPRLKNIVLEDSQPDHRSCNGQWDSRDDHHKHHTPTHHRSDSHARDKDRRRSSQDHGATRLQQEEIQQLDLKEQDQLEEHRSHHYHHHHHHYQRHHHHHHHQHQQQQRQQQRYRDGRRHRSNSRHSVEREVSDDAFNFFPAHHDHKAEEDKPNRSPETLSRKGEAEAYQPHSRRSDSKREHEALPNYLTQQQESKHPSSLSRHHHHLHHQTPRQQHRSVVLNGFPEEHHPNDSQRTFRRRAYSACKMTHRHSIDKTPAEKSPEPYTRTRLHTVSGTGSYATGSSPSRHVARRFSLAPRSRPRATSLKKPSRRSLDGAAEVGNMRPRTSSLPTKNSLGRLMSPRHPYHHHPHPHSSPPFSPRGDNDVFYTVRSFVTTPKGQVVNRGDSLRSRSNSSVVSSASGSVNELTQPSLESSSPLFGGPDSPGPGPAPEAAPTLRVMVLGSDGVGKTSLVEQFSTSEYLGMCEQSDGK